MRDVLQAHLDRYWACRDSGVSARGTEAWDDIRHECRQAAYVEDWRDLEAEYERLRSQVNPHWEPLDWYATYVEPQSRTLPETVPTTTTTTTVHRGALRWNEVDATKADCENLGPGYEWRETGNRPNTFYDDGYSYDPDGYDWNGYHRDGTYNANKDGRIRGRWVCAEVSGYQEALDEQKCLSGHPGWGWHHTGTSTVNGVKQEVWTCQLITYSECYDMEGRVIVLASNEHYDGSIAC